MANPIAIGIDLGTSNSCVAVVGQDGRPQVLADESGNKVHASVVSFQPGNRVVVGNDAKRMVISHAETTVASAKRLMGRFFFSDEVKKAMRRYAFELVEGENSSVKLKIGGYLLSPAEVGAVILRKMKRIAETALGVPVSQAVITVPAYFNDNQRQATRDAGEIAGLDVLRIINEPTAAALAYGFGRELTQRVAVYDLGGGTFDVSILEIGGDIYEVLSTAGDTFLGGDDIDERIVNFLANTFHQQHGVDLRGDRRVMPLITSAAEMAKVSLASDDSYAFFLPGIAKNEQGAQLDLAATLTHSELGRMSMDLLQRTFKVCDEAMQAAHMTAADLDGAILVGGPTRLPFIRTAVEHYFQQPAQAGVDPDEVVALGAALQAHTLVTATASDAMLLDVTPLPLRIATVGGFTEEIIEKNTPIPIERSKRFTTVRDNQERVEVVVLQGEDRKQDKCELLGHFEVSGLRPAPRGTLQIDVTFEIDASGIVHVSAKDVETGNAASTTVELSSGLSRDDIEQSRQRMADADLVSFSG